jgi:hypothetical protein
VRVHYGKLLSRRSAQLAADVQQLVDQNDIENLQRIYGFYIDKSQWAQAVSLFTDDAEFEIAGVGVFRGKARIAAYFAALGPDGKLEGKLYDNMVVVHTQMVEEGDRGDFLLLFERGIEFATLLALAMGRPDGIRVSDAVSQNRRGKPQGLVTFVVG